MALMTIRDYFPNYLSEQSLFTKMSSLGAPWSADVGQDMDDAYFTMYSGIKNPSEFVLLHLDPLTNLANSLTIARILYGVYGNSWSRLWEAYSTSYSPLDDYSMEEVINRTRLNDKTSNKDEDKTNTVSDTTTTEYGQTIDTTQNSKSYQFGFNSTSGSPISEQDDVSSENNGGSDTTTQSVSETGKTTGTVTDNEKEEEGITTSRKGKSGSFSYQELLKQEFELWRWNFFTQIFKDTDSFLTLSVYSHC